MLWAETVVFKRVEGVLQTVNGGGEVGKSVRRGREAAGGIQLGDRLAASEGDVEADLVAEGVCDDSKGGKEVRWWAEGDLGSLWSVAKDNNVVVVVVVVVGQCFIGGSGVGVIGVLVLV